MIRRTQETIMAVLRFLNILISEEIRIMDEFYAFKDG
jgi:hypothetical protein